MCCSLADSVLVNGLFVAGALAHHSTVCTAFVAQIHTATIAAQTELPPVADGKVKFVGSWQMLNL